MVPVSAEDDGSQSIPLNDEISFAVPAVTVDDLDIRRSIVTGKDKVACINGAGGVIRGAGAVEGLDLAKAGLTGGSRIVMIDGDRERVMSGCSESPYRLEVGDGDPEGTKVVSDTNVTSDTALAVLPCLNHALSGIVNAEPLLNDLRCLDMASPRNFGDPVSFSILP